MTVELGNGLVRFPETFSPFQIIHFKCIAIYILSEFLSFHSCEMCMYIFYSFHAGHTLALARLLIHNYSNTELTLVSNGIVGIVNLNAILVHQYTGVVCTPGE